ncbi:hypothetical protein Ga0466249_002786 [Sporomusaceae bacterium BoRhaA]|uniref:rolling circle replication-associated protein n=1 Tax=Pelorhabdus rhamnosifermentans TaxID=2772457 RepID=UPI001C05EDDA|nr:hypothetical protein [Pelorhabdus rhamnosifermentans]MBU2701667.1 hypothetical protein [Pelorhabdus rhamnosifermentans]
MSYIRRIKKTLDGRIIEKNLYYTYHAMPTGKEAKKRAKRINQTPEQQKKDNRRRATEKLAMQMANNFKSGDWYFTLTIAGKVPDYEEIKKKFDNFKKNLRRYYKRKGDELKYIAVMENMTGQGRPHAHLLINALTAEDMAEIKKYWTFGGARVEFFGGEIDDCVKLSAYFKKEDVEKHSGRLQTSTNLVEPHEEKSKVNRSECYSTQIKVPKGYHIHKGLTYQGYTKDGYPCQHIVFVKD